MKSIDPSFFSRLVRQSVIAAALLACGILHETASAVTAFGIDGNDYLRSISNLSTMSSSVLGLTPFTYGATNGNVGLAQSPSGQLYAGDNFGNIPPDMDRRGCGSANRRHFHDRLAG